MNADAEYDLNTSHGENQAAVGGENVTMNTDIDTTE
jgi:hypothetical protein